MSVMDIAIGEYRWLLVIVAMGVLLIFGWAAHHLEKWIDDD